MAEIRLLDPIVASRIAAGEVVERPASVLRELLDNAIDAGAQKISVYLQGGGIKGLTVVDDGCGMSAEDLTLACVSHATSKVYTLDDLFNLHTLGFRGEALSSIAACSKLTIDSNGHRIIVDNGVQSAVLPGSTSGTSTGTSVTMEDLFENIPARKLFLKRPQAEASECKKIFLEKALGFESVEFLFFTDGTLNLHLPSTDKKERSVQVMNLDKSFMPAGILQMSYQDENLHLYAVSSDPSCHRRDRSQIRILVNNRIIDSYQFVQAITNAYTAALPGGAFPFFYLFIEDNPALVDFNIHPTKRECKLRNQAQIYGAITTMIRRALVEKIFTTDNRVKNVTAGNITTGVANQDIQPSLLDASNSDFQSSSKMDHAGERVYPSTQSEFSVNRTSNNISVAEKPRSGYTPSDKPFDPSWFENAKAILAKKNANKSNPANNVSTDTQQLAVSEISTTKIVPNYRYVGQLFKTFLLVEMDDKILFIDQHALHERLLYDEIRSLKDVQRLIVPYSFEVDISVDEYLQKNSVLYSDFGIELTRKEPLIWEMASLPAACKKNEEQIIAYIENETGDIESVQKGLFSIIACHAAIKAGDELDDFTAKSLVDKCFSLDRMVCPHGRDFTYSIKKEELYRQVGRIV